MQLPTRNSTVLPVIDETLDINPEINVGELETVVRRELNIPKKLSIVLFLWTPKKWHRLKRQSQLSDYPLDAKKSRLDIKKTVSTKKVNSLQIAYRDLSPSDFPYGVLGVEAMPAADTKQVLVDKAQGFLFDTLNAPRQVSFQIPSRSRDNVSYDDELQMVLLGRQRIERQFRSLGSVKSVAQMSMLMRILFEVLDREIHTTKRDLFYMAVNEFETQGISDALIEDLGAMMQVTRPSMNIWASSKGVVIGRLKYRERGDLIDCSKIGSGKSIAPNVDDIDSFESDAEFVLVVEKDAVFNRLAEDHFYDYVPCIIVTAKGQPDMATREFLRRINDELKLPILAIMDADVYGFEIMRVYSIGSKALSFEARSLAVPNIKWLGLLPSDLRPESGFGIPSSAFIKNTQADVKKARRLLEEEFVIKRPRWREELETLLELGIKAEIQALNARDPQFITNHYLPEKLERGDFI